MSDSKDTTGRTCYRIEVAFYGEDVDDPDSFVSELNEWVCTKYPGFSGLVSMQWEHKDV